MKLPRFNLRDLFWLVLAAACLCAWWSEWEQRHVLNRNLDGIKTTLESNGYVIYTNWKGVAGLLCKFLGHNICSLISAIYELGLSPVFGVEVATA